MIRDCSYAVRAMSQFAFRVEREPVLRAKNAVRDAWSRGRSLLSAIGPDPCRRPFHRPWPRSLTQSVHGL